MEVAAAAPPDPESLPSARIECFINFSFDHYCNPLSFIIMLIYYTVQVYLFHYIFSLKQISVKKNPLENNLKMERDVPLKH